MAQLAAGQTEAELSKFNLEVVTCFQDFIKYNPQLYHLNLERCGLIDPALKYIVALLRKSQALRCLHLCGNVGLSPELIEWIRLRVHAKPSRPQNIMEKHNTHVRYRGKTTERKGMPLRRGLMKVHRAGSIEF